jgi:D-alanyl-D-alanine carboxypeptidase (penicillin-binding protein 5/6)
MNLLSDRLEYRMIPLPKGFKPLIASLLLTALASLTTLATAGQAPVPKPPTVPTNSYILVDHDSGRVLAEEKSDARMEPASITKLMTGYIVFKALDEQRLKLTDLVTVSEHAWRAGGSASGGSTTFLVLGSQVPVEVLIKGMIIQSGNDATIALAEKVGGTEDGFAQMMNEYAQRLGLTGTHFQNSWGGPAPDHYSTARDLALLASAIIREFPEYYKWYSVREFTWNGIKQPNRNGLLARDPSVDGMKTGHTDNAKYCLVSSAKRDGMRLISVVLGSPTQKAREDASAALLNYGFTFFETVPLQAGGKALLTPKVYKGATDSVPVGITQDVSVTIPRGQGTSLGKEIKVEGKLIAPLESGQTVGEMTVTAGDAIVARVPLVTLSAVKPAGFFGSMYDTVVLWFK